MYNSYEKCFADIIAFLPNLFMKEGSKLHFSFFARIDYD